MPVDPSSPVLLPAEGAQAEQSQDGGGTVPSAADQPRKVRCGWAVGSCRHGRPHVSCLVYRVSRLMSHVVEVRWLIKSAVGQRRSGSFGVLVWVLLLR